MREFGPHIKAVVGSFIDYKLFSLQNRFSDHCDQAVQLHLIRVNVSGSLGLESCKNLMSFLSHNDQGKHYE
jgi:hypothetical protein